jgi:hypothetical protein
VLYFRFFGGVCILGLWPLNFSHVVISFAHCVLLVPMIALIILAASKKIKIISNRCSGVRYICEFD